MKRLREIQPGKMNQADFAETLGISFNTWNNYERGYSIPERDIAFKIKDRYHVTLDWILEGDPRGLPHQLYEQLYGLRETA